MQAASATFKKGDRIAVTGNEIFGVMGFKRVTGTVFVVNPNGKSLSIKCDQTGAIELFELDDGLVTRL